MKKQIMIVAIIFILTINGLNGCNENTIKSDEEKIIGTWTNRNLHEGNIETNSYIFYTNKTFKVIGTYKDEVLNINGTWNITENGLIMIAQGETKTAEYIIYDNNKKLTLKIKNGDSINFIKEQV
jgi:hypothetical protein